MWEGMLILVVGLFIGYWIGVIASIVRVNRSIKSLPEEVRRFFNKDRLQGVTL